MIHHVIWAEPDSTWIALRKEQGKKKSSANENNCSEGHDNVWQWSPVWILTFTLPVKAHKAFGK